jgi:hypothetical protein
MRRHIHALVALAADLVYCPVCGWWYPPHGH